MRPIFPLSACLILVSTTFAAEARGFRMRASGAKPTVAPAPAVTAPAASASASASAAARPSTAPRVPIVYVSTSRSGQAAPASTEVQGAQLFKAGLQPFAVRPAAVAAPALIAPVASIPGIPVPEMGEEEKPRKAPSFRALN